MDILRSAAFGVPLLIACMTLWLACAVAVEIRSALRGGLLASALLTTALLMAATWARFSQVL